MALTYADFLEYPLQIAGIDASETVGETTTYFYSEKITEIETFVVEDMAYNGSVSLSAILPYFVYWFICRDWKSNVMVEAGESEQLKEFTVPSIMKQVRNWNIGVDKLRAALGITDELIDEQNQTFVSQAIHNILESNDISINENYLSKRSLL